MREALNALALIAAICPGAGCVQQNPPVLPTAGVTLTIGLGSAPGESTGAGIPSTFRLIALESLVAYSSTGRPEQRLAEAWTPSDDGLAWRIRLRPNIEFHDGDRVTSGQVRDLLLRDLPAYMGPAFEGITEILTPSDDVLDIHLKRRSTFLMDSLDVPIQKPGLRRDDPPLGTGAFRATGPLDGQEVEMLANESHYAGKPAIDRIVLRRYPSIRSAWADMLRGQVDMLFEVGVDALDLIQPSHQTSLFTFQRPYAYTVILNTRRPVLRDAALRRSLNAAVDRRKLIADALEGHGAPAEGPVWPHHWAFDPAARKFSYDPAVLNDIQFRCIYVEGSHERIALALQQQLQEVGVQMILERLPVDEGLNRLNVGDFDAFLIDVANGPLVRPYLFWHSSGPLNYAHYANKSVDGALERIQHAASDAEYRAGVTEFQQAVVDDPPGIFLAWSERTRAVSRRFEVQAEPGQDIIRTLRLWRPSADNPTAAPN